MPYLN
jgi:hypothetical protein